MAIFKRFVQRFTHAQRYPQTIVLSDGSFIETLSLSPQRPQVTLTTDSFSHPTWRYRKESTNVTDELGKVSKFNEKFGEAFAEDLFTEIE